MRRASEFQNKSGVPLEDTALSRESNTCLSWVTARLEITEDYETDDTWM